MRPINDRWKGRLSKANVEQIAKVFSQIFGRRRRFTYTRVRPDYVKVAGITPFIDTRVDIYTGVKLEARRKGIKVAPVMFEVDETSAMLTIITTEYLCMYDTTLESWHPPTGDNYDYAYKFPHINFEGDKVTIKYQTPCGDQAVDVFALEIR
jgi:hypothetical protein